LKNLKLSKHWLKMRLISKSRVSGHKMEGNLIPINLMSFVKLMESKDTFLLEGLLSKMESLKGKIKLFKR
jgi:hypothetical protein